MASPEAVRKALSVLKHLPSDQPMTDETVAFYAIGLREIPDAALTVAVERAVSTCTFRPLPAEIVKLSGHAKPKALPDVQGIYERLRGMAAQAYSPQGGEEMPSVERVRFVLGDAIADAYGFVGPKRLEACVFGGDGVGADIAAREFADHLATAQHNGAPLTLPTVAETLRLNAAPLQLPATVTKLLREANPSRTPS